MNNLLENIIVSLLTSAIIALGVAIWKWILSEPLLMFIYKWKIQTIKGTWSTTWPFGTEELVIKQQAGKWLYGTRTFHFQPPQEYLLKGELIEDTMVAYCTPKKKGSLVGTMTLRISADGCRMQGKITGIDPSNDQIFTTENEWRRQS